MNFSIDCYKISGNSISQYTNKQQHYEITVNDKNYSIWDYYANTYVKKLYLNVLENKNFNVIKNITLNNIKHEIDQNKYVKVKGEYLPIYEVQNYQEIVCPNGSKEGGAGVGHFTTNYNSGDTINVRCIYKGIENETYAAPLNGTTLLCWYKPDENIEGYENKTTYEIMSLNFGLNEPVFNYTIIDGFLSLFIYIRDYCIFFISRCFSTYIIFYTSILNIFSIRIAFNIISSSFIIGWVEQYEITITYSVIKYGFI